MPYCRYVLQIDLPATACVVDVVPCDFWRPAALLESASDAFVSPSPEFPLGALSIRLTVVVSNSSLLSGSSASADAFLVLRSVSAAANSSDASWSSELPLAVSSCAQQPAGGSVWWRCSGWARLSAALLIQRQITGPLSGSAALSCLCAFAHACFCCRVVDARPTRLGIGHLWDLRARRDSPGVHMARDRAADSNMWCWLFVSGGCVAAPRCCRVDGC
jgi:hypothetical protein